MPDFMNCRFSSIIREEASAWKGIEAKHDSVVRVDTSTRTLYAIGECGPAQYSTTSIGSKKKESTV
jgi:hypothetical protein